MIVGPVMASASSSPDTGSDLEKSDFEKAREAKREEEEERMERGRGSTEIGPGGLNPRPHLRSGRSRSSARSHKSYTDGYTHFGDEDEEKQKQNAAAARGDGFDPENEFEVGFDGDSDPLSPRNKTALRKWLIVLIVSASSLCVTCASALYTSTYPQLEKEFGTNREIATLGLT